MSNKLEDFFFNLIGLLLIIFIVYVGVSTLHKIETGKTEPEITSAHPISQQKIGDEADPDILIIYEAEVDGDTVYPTVIKEAK